MVVDTVCYKRADKWQYDPDEPEGDNQQVRELEPRTQSQRRDNAEGAPTLDLSHDRIDKAHGHIFARVLLQRAQWHVVDEQGINVWPAILVCFSRPGTYDARGKPAERTSAVRKVSDAEAAIELDALRLQLVA